MSEAEIETNSLMVCSTDLVVFLLYIVLHLNSNIHSKLDFFSFTFQYKPSDGLRTAIGRRITATIHIKIAEPAILANPICM